MKKLSLLLLSLWVAMAWVRADVLLPGVKRIVFLGDSITYSGQYVDDFEAWMFLTEPDRRIDVLNLGLPSETVSGLSEPGHADGKFPRPDLHERLARVLAQAKPDLIFACYGMNDGIYLPLDEERFARFRQGMEKLHAAAVAAGARIVHLTPPIYDPVPTHHASEYDAVLAKYAEWLLSKRAEGWETIDLHGPMTAALEKHRQTQPNFSFSQDGVHPNEEGHRVMANALLHGLGVKQNLPGTPAFAALVKDIREQERLLTDAWLTACGHLRPGMAHGLPLAEAEARAETLRPKILAGAQAARSEAK